MFYFMTRLNYYHLIKASVNSSRFSNARKLLIQKQRGEKSKIKPKHSRSSLHCNYDCVFNVEEAEMKESGAEN